ncbi:FAD-dependent oxidoreductase [Longimicrobium terrae]|uniref:D-amino-acid oxidase n=1 Tax=Longimicrobium terrae TaxID=1639882 RepID=A0A841H2H8_9BACT|nr:FAD-dependent oxidoreductase [Longimicrobium terrae]MBB4637672.1 D-amino-acid oxidase [Longimicrobium terrae]MBB6072069.1 D-amino-acid oxidase [Longimicrobium terrae]NNC29847.1 FAD-dependent oxidoreductase [Longimicrobium terrae]
MQNTPFRASGDDVLVLGSGVIGLAAAVRLAESGRRVRVWGPDPVEAIVSSAAAAIWYPYKAAPMDLVARWALRTREQLLEDARDPASGVREVEGTEVWNGDADPVWAIHGMDAVPREIIPSPIPEYTDAQTLRLPVAEMPVYLRWLAARLNALGVQIEPRRASTLDEPMAAAPMVINCTGLAAGALAGDPSVHPIRGQIVRVRNPGIERFWLAVSPGAEPIYIVPRAGDVILGGTAQANDARLETDAHTAEEILSRCARFEPSLADAEILQHRAALRPGRAEVRLERVDREDGRAVIHNYGHGGSGVTVAWGCADEVVALLD